jgi:hypothetical protein
MAETATTSLRLVVSLFLCCPRPTVRFAAMAIDATTRGRSLMSGYAVAHLDEIEEASDGRCPWRPVRQHFGITAFWRKRMDGPQRG